MSIKARQCNKPERLFFQTKKELFRWNSNPHHTAYEGDILPTELPRQLSWLVQVSAREGQPVKPNLYSSSSLLVVTLSPTMYVLHCLQQCIYGILTFQRTTTTLAAKNIAQSSMYVSQLMCHIYLVLQPQCTGWFQLILCVTCILHNDNTLPHCPANKPT